MFKGYVDPEEGRLANKQLPRLMTEGLLMGGTGLGILALIFEIAADAFSVAAYQTLLAIHGAGGHHTIAIWAFIILSILLYLGIVPAYKAGAYLRPNAGGSGPLVEAIGPSKIRWLSWIGTSLFFIDAILTIIISSISAADAIMLLLPELAAYRILLAELFAFFIMAVLVIWGPKRAVPLFLIGGGAFTLFTLGALGMVTWSAAAHPEWAFLADGIVSRLEMSGVVEHVVAVAKNTTPEFATRAFFSFLVASMASAMLGFSGYEVIPASGKHAARPKWKVINMALTLAAVFLIGTGMMQLFVAQRWNIPSTEGYSTLLIEYEIAAAQMLGNGVDESQIVVSAEDRAMADEWNAAHGGHSDDSSGEGHGENKSFVTAENIAMERAITQSIGRLGGGFLLTAGVLLAVILLLAQGGGYVGGSAVAANAARLGRLPRVFEDDRVGIAVIWLISAILIPIIREVLIVEAYYAFGFVSAFVITSTTVFFVRDDVLKSRGIEPGSSEAKSLKFAGFRGMIASYVMGIVLITQKFDALPEIVIAGILLTLIQLYVARGGIRKPAEEVTLPVFASGTTRYDFETGTHRALFEARQRGLADALDHLIEHGKVAKFNVETDRVRRMIAHLYNIPLGMAGLDTKHGHGGGHHDEHVEEPSLELEAVYQDAYSKHDEMLAEIEKYSHFGIFMFIHNYHLNWVNDAHGRTAEVVQKAMVEMLFANIDHDEIWPEYQAFEPYRLHENVWQFAREWYDWAKDQWPNLSDRITTIWTLQEFNLLSDNIDVETIVAVAGGRQHKRVRIKPQGKSETVDV